MSNAARRRRPLVPQLGPDRALDALAFAYDNGDLVVHAMERDLTCTISREQAPDQSEESRGSA